MIKVILKIFSAASGPTGDGLLEIVHHCTNVLATDALAVISALGGVTIKKIMTHSQIVTNFMGNYLKNLIETLL